MQRYTVILSPDAELGVYTATCPAMPGAVTEGDTREKALSEMAVVMEVWIELAAARGYRPLAETPELVAQALAETLEDRAEEGWDLTVETQRRWLRSARAFSGG